MANSAEARGGGTYIGTITNSIVWGNTAPDGPEHWGAAIFHYSCTEPLPGGAGNINDDPLFVNPDNGNFKLHFFSPALDAGTNHTWMVEALDLDGQPRLLVGLNQNRNQPPRVDMGAYELMRPIPGTIYMMR